MFIKFTYLIRIEKGVYQVDFECVQERIEASYDMELIEWTYNTANFCCKLFQSSDWLPATLL